MITLKSHHRYLGRTTAKRCRQKNIPRGGSRKFTNECQLASRPQPTLQSENSQHTNTLWCLSPTLLFSSSSFVGWLARPTIAQRVDKHFTPRIHGGWQHNTTHIIVHKQFTVRVPVCNTDRTHTEKAPSRHPSTHTHTPLRDKCHQRPRTVTPLRDTLPWGRTPPSASTPTSTNGRRLHGGCSCTPHTTPHQASSFLSSPVPFSRWHQQHYEWPRHQAESTPTPRQRTGNIKPRSPGREKEGVKLCGGITHIKIVYYVAQPRRLLPLRHHSEIGQVGIIKKAVWVQNVLCALGSRIASFHSVLRQHNKQQYSQPWHS
ncbi:unnamed protein product [Ectocarpus sp. 13 AM-2016]